MATYTPIQAIRAYHRVMRPINLGFDMAYEFDTKFDGGEFSGPALDRMHDDTSAAVLARVCDRMGVTVNDAMSAMYDCIDKEVAAFHR